VLAVEGLSAADSRGLPAVRQLSMTVRGGEVLGIAGVSGNGQSELAEVLFGLRAATAGSVRLAGRDLAPGNPAAAVRNGMARVPEDRIGTGLLMDLSVEENLILEDHGRDPFSRRGLLHHPSIHERSDRLMEDYNIKAAGRDAPAKSLSGGNLQKVILARELSGEPVLVVAAQPTRGLDVGAMEYVHNRILAQRDRGAGVLLISEDLDEIMGLSDRILVIYEGKVVGETSAEEASREQIGLWMTGASA
jgi:simple sugar transport system ATP-binding protein